MKPISFPQQTKTLSKPQNMTDEECSSLPVWNDGETCISLWKPTLRERLSILFFGRVWVHVLSGHTQPPIAIEGKKQIFYRKSNP